VTVNIKNIDATILTSGAQLLAIMHVNLSIGTEPGTFPNPSEENSDRNQKTATRARVIPDGIEGAKTKKCGLCHSGGWLSRAVMSA
jgi:hypothetical protein